MYELIESIQQIAPQLAVVPEPVMILALSLAFGAGVLGVIAVNALAAVWLERKVSAHMQDRLGPMHVGWHGVLQTLADGLKLIMKEDIIPRDVDAWLYRIAPGIVFTAATAVFVAVPFSASLIAANLNIGIFYILAMSSVVVVGIIMAGWSSNNKWSLYGTMRAAAQIVSYEIPTAVALLTGVITIGTLNMQEIVQYQDGGLFHWLIFKTFPFNLIAAVLYFIASLAEVNRSPFDMPEAESELVSGYHTEYSGMRFAYFFMAEYANMFVVGAVMSIFFLGGWQPLFPFLDFIPGPIWLVSKIYALLFIQMWLRWTLPRYRVDQLMDLCWKVLVPAAFVNLVGAGLYLLIFS